MTNPILTIKMTKPGVELALSALATMPYSQSAGLIAEIEAQANYQLQQLQAAADAAAPAAEEAPVLTEKVEATNEETAQ
jgi:hypothetical protein